MKGVERALLVPAVASARKVAVEVPVRGELVVKIIGPHRDKRPQVDLCGHAERRNEMKRTVATRRRIISR
jgi:hypothetical protein